MRLIVDIYKDTAKWYTTLIINNETEIRMYDKDYDDFLKSSFKIPEGGYAVVRDSEENETLHQRLYTSEKLR